MDRARQSWVWGQYQVGLSRVGCHEDRCDAAVAGPAGIRPAIAGELEAPVFAAHGMLREIKRSLQAQGAEIALLSGSGATVFGVFADEARARLAQAQFMRENFMKVFVVPTCSGPLSWRYERPQ
jgi:4-diphosphocytidyl-2-C-methyl-D-erythritol kinase